MIGSTDIKDKAHKRREPMSEKKLSRREKEKRTQRRDMLSAALSLFSKKGYHNVSMQEIAKTAEFAIGTLYKFFQNKEELYRALVLEQSEKFHKAMASAIDESEDEMEILRNYVRTKSKLFCENLQFIRLYLAENRGMSYTLRKGFDEEMRKRYNQLLEKLASAIDRGIKKKRFRDIADPFGLAVAIDSTVNSFHLLWLDTPEKYPYPEDPDAVLNIFFKGLVGS